MENNVIFLGDIHGEFKTLMFNIERMGISDSTIIQVGDFGVGFYDEIKDNLSLLTLNIFFKERNIIFLAIRGNHDDPKFFDGRINFSNIKLLSDYTKLRIGDLNYLFIGGALSIDRLNRIETNENNDFKVYWKDEVFVFDETKTSEFNDIDVLVTHTTPSMCYPTLSESFGELVERFASSDENLKMDLTIERNNMTNMFELLTKNNNIKYHVYGHFHHSHVSEINGCIHTLLGIHELKQIF